MTKQTMLEITPLQPGHLPAAAGLFSDNFRQLRQAMPILPARLEDSQAVAGLLRYILSRSAGLAAWEQGRLAGYLAWFEVGDFRDTGCKAAYVPEWGHATVGTTQEQTDRVYRALYRAAGAQWQAHGCGVHAITLLAHDSAARQAWFWSGFGMNVVDAVRPMQPIETAAAPAAGLAIRQATPADAALLAALDAEHCQHYTTSPIFMMPRHASTPEEINAFLAAPPNSMWLALDGKRPAGYLVFSGASEGAAEIVASDATAAITGAYVRPEYRGRRVAPALLNAASEHYWRAGFTCCAVDFESLNPEASDFWLRYFTPVCYSLFRVPENTY